MDEVDFSTDINKDTLIDKIGKLSLLKQEKNVIDQSLDSVKKEISELSEEIFILMESDNIESISINGSNYHRRLDRYIGFQDKQRGFEWLRGLGLGGLINETVNYRTLTSEVKRLEGEGEEIPEGMISEKVVRRIGDTKSARK